MTESWIITHLDRDDKVKGPLNGVTGGSLDWSIHKQVRGGGSLELTYTGQQVDWLNDRIRVTHSRDGELRHFGVFLPQISSWHHADTGRRASVKLVDKTDILRSQVGTWYQAQAGVAILPTVAKIIRDFGEDNLALASSPLTLRSTLTWDPDKTWLTVINDLLEAAGYGALWCDGTGWFRAEPYRLPDQRPLAAVYGGDSSDYRMLRSYEDVADLGDIPNVLVAVSQGDASKHGLRGVARNEDPNSPLSIQSRGREILRTVTGLEAASQSVIDGHAKRLLAEATEVTRKVTWTHPVDDVAVDDAIQIRPLGLRGSVTQRKITLGIGAVVQDTCRHIYTGGKLWQT